MAFPTDNGNRVENQPVQNGDARSAGSDRQINAFGDGREPFGAKKGDFTEALTDAYGPGGSRARSDMRVAGGPSLIEQAEEQGERTSQNRAGQDKLWGSLTPKDLDGEETMQRGVKQALQDKGIDVDAALRDGSLQQRLENTYVRGIANFTNAGGEQSFHSFIQQHNGDPSRADQNENKSMNQMWKDEGLQRPTLGPNASLSEIAAVLAKDAEISAMKINPELRSMTPEQREEAMNRGGIHLNAQDLEMVLKMTVGQRVQAVMESLRGK